MLQWLLSRIFRPGSARTGSPLKNLTVASESKPLKTLPSPSASQRPRQRDEGTPDQAKGVVPTRLLDDIVSLQQRYHRDMTYYQKIARIQAEQEISGCDMTPHIECIRQTTGYTFKDADLVRGAIFKSVNRYKGEPTPRATQLQLAKLGDELFKSVFQYTNFPYTVNAFDAEDHSNFHWNWLVSNATLHFAAERLELPRRLAESGYSTHIKSDGEKGFGTLVEAIIGAVYIDSGENGAVTRSTMARLLGTSMEREELQRFYRTFRTQVSKPGPASYCHSTSDKSDARLQHEDESVSPNEDVESRLQDWANSVDKLSRRHGRTKRMAPRRTIRLSGDDLRRHITKVRRHAVQLMSGEYRYRSGTRKRVKAELRRRADFMLEWVEQAEKRLGQGQDFPRF